MQVDLGGVSGAGGIHEALMFPGCADFQPLYYCNGLADAIVNKYGGQIFEHSQVTKTQGKQVPHRTVLVLYFQVLTRQSPNDKEYLLIYLPSTDDQVRHVFYMKYNTYKAETSSLAAALVAPGVVWLKSKAPAGEDDHGPHSDCRECGAGDKLAHPPQSGCALAPGALPLLCCRPAYPQGRGLKIAHICRGR